MNILVYDGPGVTSLQRILLKSLNSLLKSNYDVIPIDPARLRQDPWEETTRLLIMPGGRDLAFLSSLENDGIQKIKSYVESGGKYLGICGGAYLACKSIQFELGRKDYQVVGDRPLKFCQAEAVGSVAEGFIYNTELGTRAMEIYSSQDRLNVYVNGGPYFEFNDIDSNADILYRYQLNQKPCIVDCKVGKGQAILSGCHFEVASEFIKSSIDGMENDEKYIDEVENLNDIYPKLNESEKGRVELFKRILNQLGLELSQSLDDVLLPSPLLYFASTDKSKLSKFYKDLQSESTADESGIIKVADTANTWLITSDWKKSDLAATELVLATYAGQELKLFNIHRYLELINNNELGSFLVYCEQIGSTQSTIEK